MYVSNLWIITEMCTIPQCTITVLVGVIGRQTIFTFCLFVTQEQTETFKVKVELQRYTLEWLYDL